MWSHLGKESRNLAELTVGTVTGHVSKRSLEDSSIDVALHALLEALQIFPGLTGLIEQVISCLFDRTHEGSHLFRMLAEEVVVGDVEDRAKAAAAKLS